MKALTLRPHWAWLVVNGFKDIENRSWPTRLRGRIWIHASSSPVTIKEYSRFQQICGARRVRNFPIREEFKTGGIIGSVEIADCVTASRSYWFSGDYGFVLKNALPARFRPMKGKLGFFEVASRLTPKKENDRVPPNNYVAYHSTDVMGYEYNSANGKFRFFSRKTRAYLEKAIGGDVWVITGTRDRNRKMIYRLAAVYMAEEIKDCADGLHVLGTHGYIFQTPVELNALPWFQTLLREQNRFSYGFSHIRNQKVIAGLQAIREETESRTWGEPITKSEFIEIHRSVMEAVRRSIISRRAGNRERKLAVRKGYTIAHSQADALLDALQFSPRPRLDDQRVRPVLVGAIDRDDKRFFIRFGKRLSRAPKDPRKGSTLDVPRRLEQFLIGHWASHTHDLPELFRLTPEGLADVCSHYLKCEVSVEAIVKLRQRLGLKPFTRHKIQIIRLDNKLKFL